jgi:hypothetical protein
MLLHLNYPIEMKNPINLNADYMVEITNNIIQLKNYSNGSAHNSFSKILGPVVDVFDPIWLTRVCILLSDIT